MEVNYYSKGIFVFTRESGRRNEDAEVCILALTHFLKPNSVYSITHLLSTLSVLQFCLRIEDGNTFCIS